MALDLAPETRAALGKVQREMVALGLPLRCASPSAMHLTIKFLGDLDDEVVAELAAELQSSLGRPIAAAPNLAGLGAFPSPQRVRALFAAVHDGRGAVMALMQQVEEVAALFNVPCEDRPRVPHVTIARNKDARTPRRLVQFIEARQGVPWGPVNVSPLVIYRSVLTPGGSEYTPVASIAL